MTDEQKRIIELETALKMALELLSNELTRRAVIEGLLPTLHNVLNHKLP